ncbi:hypothetical protein ABZU32_06845 [Sphaerisporangium sp. NPDC005288]|uniref:hypothetical protein n=1 Tax=Sphaerisporangium sp. NPDC005288 TaxID=3155114 RepID=UPI0033A98EAC
MLLELLFVAAIITGITGVARHANRRSTRPGRNVHRLPRRSWLVKAWNASGAPPVKGTTLGDAAAEFTGKAAGATVRTGTRLSRRAAKAAATRAKRRWESRTQEAEVIPLFRRVRPSDADDPRPEPRPDGEPQPRPESRASEPRTEPRPAEQRPDPRPADARPKLDDEVSPGGPSDERPRSDQTTAAPEPQPADRPIPSSQGEARMVPNSTTFRHTTAGQTTPGGDGAVAPPDWAQTIGRIATHVPEDDSALLHLMAGEVAGVCGYADALAALHETCVNAVGLDPSSVQGLAEYSTHASELAQRMAEAHKQFLTIYQEVMEAVARGVVMPYQGRFFSGQAV